MGADRIADVDDVPADDSFLFTVENGDGDEKEAILVELSDGAIVGWLNYCMHWTDVNLDTGDGAVRDGELVCRKHAATFEADSGVCTHGPCEGARLDPVEVDVRDGVVYLADPDYEFVRTGVDDGDPADLSTSPGSRIGF
ncbi:Rieske (2Fe-2S) protein [Halobacterium litoreum]|uniref:Rieske (2Fe-2S) protein n=1 Tax=Halobacterium litoreum TaxID=2039234 RepID=A0ABD5NHH0_9EURY|nr:Rieske 2Fe-2S domain-containing protein [Halobacterium litoreum]UHH12658.1 Rieske 2Fe-2S domain-containing protein [Halobacterium litoreum]